MAMDPPGVVLGIDFGLRRIGLAASDDLRLFAHPVETIDVRRTDPFERIAAVAEARGAVAAAVGWPVRMDGSEGTAAARVADFIGRLHRRLPDLEIVKIDERLTTAEAHDVLERAGRKGTRRNRDNQAVIDQAAAVLILQDFLDHGGTTAP